MKLRMWTLAVVLSVSTAVPAQDEPADDAPKLAQPARPVDPVQSLPVDLQTLIDNTSPEQLMGEVARIQTQLSRSGQNWLRREAKLRRYQERSAEIVSQLADDPAVQRVETLLQSPEIQQQIRGWLKLETDTEIKAVLVQFCERHRIALKSLTEYGNLKTARKVQELTERGLAMAREQLAKKNLPALPDAGVGPRGSWIQEVSVILKEMEGESTTEADMPDTAADPGDLKAILQALAG